MHHAWMLWLAEIGVSLLTLIWTGTKILNSNSHVGTHTRMNSKFNGELRCTLKNGASGPPFSMCSFLERGRQHILIAARWLCHYCENWSSHTLIFHVTSRSKQNCVLGTWGWSNHKIGDQIRLHRYQRSCQSMCVEWWDAPDEVSWRE